MLQELLLDGLSGKFNDTVPFSGTIILWVFVACAAISAIPRNNSDLLLKVVSLLTFVRSNDTRSEGIYANCLE